MANYGRGWGDGYGGQSSESVDAYQEQQEREAGQIQNAAAQRRREPANKDAVIKALVEVVNSARMYCEQNLAALLAQHCSGQIPATAYKVQKHEVERYMHKIDAAIAAANKSN